MFIFVKYLHVEKPVFPLRFIILCEPKTITLQKLPVKSEPKASEACARGEFERLVTRGEIIKLTDLLCVACCTYLFPLRYHKQ